MSLIRWKPKSKITGQDSIYDLLDFDHPFFGLTAFPSCDYLTGSGKDVFFPAMDVSEDNNNIIVKADLPGLNKEDVLIEVNDNVLTIKGERKTEKEEKDKNYLRIERTYGSFQRSLQLGSNVDKEKIKANYKNGVLEVVLPKTAKSQVKTIDIDVT